MDAQALALLASIDATLRELLTLAHARQSKQTASTDRLCDGPHGDPVVKGKDPRNWAGESMTGRRFSECQPEYLDLLAERFDYFAAQKDASDPEQARKQKFELLDANRARAWAARLRSGWKPAESAVTEGEPRW